MAAQIFYAMNQTPVAAVVGSPVTARASFLAAVDSTVANYDFEVRSNGDGLPFNAPFFNSATGLTTTIAISSSGGAIAPTVVSSATSGRFNTTPGGVNYLRVATEAAAQALILTPSRSISALGFYATDVGDFGGIASVRLTDTTGATTTFVIVDNTSTNNASGSLLFWGFVDAYAAYNKVELIFSGNGATDYYGFDDFVIAVPSQVIVPAPAPAPAPAPSPSPSPSPSFGGSVPVLPLARVAPVAMDLTGARGP